MMFYGCLRFGSRVVQDIGFRVVQDLGFRA